jgi:hypothetical protein
MLYKKLFLASTVLIVLVSLPLIGSVGASSEMWSQTYGGTDSDAAEALVQTSDGGYAIAGYTTSFGAGSYDFWLVKTDKNGKMEWNQTYGGAGNEHAYSLVETSDGGYALTGSGLFVKTDAYGVMEWNQTYGGVSLIETSDGGYAIAGSKNDDFSIVKIDASGNKEWNRTYGGPEVERAHSLVETSEGGFALAGGTTVSEGNGHSAWRFWLVRTDEDGDMLWNQTYGIANDEAYSLVRTSDGGFALAGTTYIWDPATLGAGNYDFWLVKTDESGNMEWNQTYSGGRAYALVEASDGGFALAGGSLLIKTDAYGVMEWNQTYGGVVYALVETSDGGYALTGGIRSLDTENDDFWLAKTDEYGFIPEFPSWIIMPLLLVATLVTIIYKKRLNNTSIP